MSVSANSEDLLSMYKKWPELLLRGYEEGLRVNERLDLDAYEGVVFCGMGGSGIVGDYASLFVDKSVGVVKGVKPPTYVGEGSLVVAISYSGETLETLMCVLDSIERGASILAVTRRGSTLARLAQLMGLGVASVLEGLVPRASLPNMLGLVLGALVGKSVANEVDKASEVLAEVEWSLVDRLVKHLEGGLPVIGACGSFGVLATRWSNELAENAKTPSIVEVYPEAAHNSIVGWERPPAIEYRFLLLKLHEQGICRYIEDMLEGIYAARGPLQVIDLRERITKQGLLATLLHASQLAGLVSVGLAKVKDVDPLRTVNIDTYKSSVLREVKVEVARRLRDWLG